ncbi:MAG: hypothetical protein IPK82_01435 [Polyangiaceae bacterium]|nr:hypothetical protein [Polyangiaceae bacterium]
METASEQLADNAPASGADKEPADKAPEPEKPATQTKPKESRGRSTLDSQVEDLYAMVRRLESFATDEAKRVSGKLLPQVESKARDNIWVSLLIALGLGLILGVWLTGGRRRD